ncbi:MAG: DUF983 domain-containing protein [Stellaceae bacterium]
MPTGSTLTSILRGLRRRCPKCGEGALYRRYLKPVAQCDRCGEAFDRIRADDFPPYLTILIVGHVVVPLILLTQPLGLSTALQVALWVPVTLLLVLLLLPRFKGAIIGLMWSLGMGAAKPLR